ncbi:P-loop containing nucleoside triphosphate hydrolase protein [Stachybotrys elegans]|uniref:P-loop containing nucleoside triphosphate hydrolase protein n=1 Tax=Stachybotrys elegans TaxID=80388 RepID=A0A8K0WSG8_9HYPO|nr:P-loop containing nucleoside triphosphate hydrolase protein [Stachybotrys elegans]
MRNDSDSEYESVRGTEPSSSVMTENRPTPGEDAVPQPLRIVHTEQRSGASRTSPDTPVFVIVKRGRPPTPKPPAENPPPVSPPAKGGRAVRMWRGLLIALGIRTSSIPPQLPKPRQELDLQFLFVGCKGVGQTSLLYRARYQQFPHDTSNVTDLRMVQRLSYQHWDAIFLCFDIRDKRSLQNVLTWWRDAYHGGFARDQAIHPYLSLIGLKKDLRDRCQSPEHRAGVLAQDMCFVYPTCCVATADGQRTAARVGGARYIEVSSKTGENLHVIYNEIPKAIATDLLHRRETENTWGPGTPVTPAAPRMVLD